MDDPYAVDARFYQLIHTAGGDDIPLWQSFAGRTDQPVLEVGTGTGRIAVALAAEHDVTGIDPSPAMLAIARREAEAAGVAPSLRHGTALTVPIEPDHYGLVIVPADVFLYCADGEEQLGWLRELARALTFNGLLAIDLPGPALWLDPATNSQPLQVFAGPCDDGHLVVTQVHEDDLALQTRLLRITYDVTTPAHELRRYHSEHRLRYVYRFEMEYLLHLSGLSLLDVYGDYDLGPLTNDSERMILISRRAGG
ncbi:MAG: class I SAM-dependent methyltransferase [Dehalococcoidia bacterium]